MAENKRHFDRPALMLAPHVQIATAHTGGFHLQFDTITAHFRFGNIPKFDFTVFSAVFDKCLHERFCSDGDKRVRSIEY